MAKTALQLVQKVLVNLRENSTITDFSAVYSAMLLEFVNKAKEKVEDSWRWRSLVTEVQFVTNDHQVQYFVDSSATNPTPSVAVGSNLPADQRSYVIQDSRGNWQAFDITQASSLTVYTMSKIAREDITLDNYVSAFRTTTLPYKFAYTMENGRPAIYLSDPPPANRTIAVRFIVPQPELVNTTDTLLVPWRPVVSFATAFAMQERGEELGSSADLYMATANEELLREQDSDTEASYNQLLSLDA